jgi:Holliday junction resolvase
MKNSKRKGKVGELEFASLLRDHGYDARRGQQFAGGAESPDVMSNALGFLHIEIKRVQHLNLTDACVQAEGDCGGKPWIVAHRRNNAPWLITMRSETFFQFLRGTLPPEK